MKAQNSKLMRWALILQDYDFEVKVVKGTMNCVADALFDDQTTTDEENRTLEINKGG